MRRNSTGRLLTLSGSVLFFHLLTSIIQEAVFYLPGFRHTLLLTCTQAFLIALLASVQLYRSSPVSSSSPWRRLTEGRRVPLTTYFLISITTTLSAFLTNEASRRLNYSTQVLFKSSKLLFVWGVRYVAIELPARAARARDAAAEMEGELDSEGQFLNHSHSHMAHDHSDTTGDSVSVPVLLKTDAKTHAKGTIISPHRSRESGTPPLSSKKNQVANNMFDPIAERNKTIREIISCFTVVMGLIIFTYAGSVSKSSHHGKEKDEESHWANLVWGIGCVVVALLCDAFMYLGEEKYCFRARNASNDEVQFYLFLFSSFNGFAMLVLGGEVPSSLEFMRKQLMFTPLLVTSSITNYCGSFALIHIVSEFNSNVATIVTSTRKMFTILCSFIVYPKPFTIFHFLGIILVMGGIWQYEMALKKQTTKNTANGADKEEDEEDYSRERNASISGKVGNQ